MSGSELTTGVGSGAATSGAGAAIIGSNSGLSLLGWIAMTLGVIVVLSFIILFFLKRK